MGDPAAHARSPDLETHLQAIGRRLWDAVRAHPQRGEIWDSSLLGAAVDDDAFRTDLLRLVDVLPAVRTPRSLAEHVREYLVRPERTLPGLLDFAVRAAGSRAGAMFAHAAVRQQVSRIGSRFICAASADDAAAALGRLAANGFAYTADLLGEAVVGEAEATAYINRYHELIDALADLPQGDESAATSAVVGNVSVKLSSISPHLQPQALDHSVSALVGRLTPLLEHARARRVFVNIDMEQWRLHDVTLSVLERVAVAPALADWPHLGIALQCYLESAPEDVARVAALADGRDCPLTVRLVKGAYWDSEMVLAEQNGWRNRLQEVMGLWVSWYQGGGALGITPYHAG